MFRRRIHSMKRQKFLETFLTVFGAKQIHWTACDENSIYGTVIFDTIDVNEKQNFVWHMTENKTPDEKVQCLIEYLIKNHLIDGDKLLIPAAGIEIHDMNNDTKTKLFDELFSIRVSMIDNGEETDCYFIHE